MASRFWEAFLWEGKNVNNSWNQFIYKLWSPIYDRFFNTGIFLKARRNIFKELTLEKGSKVLLVGVGTGADIPFFLNKGYEITAIDFSAEMLEGAKKKYRDTSITFIHMDAQEMEFKSDSFDFVVASLLLSVVPDPEKTLREMVRVVKKNSKILIFDKFVPKNKKVRITQRLLRPLIKLLGTDIGLEFYDVFKFVEDQCDLLHDDNIMFNGMYRKIICMKKGKIN